MTFFDAHAFGLLIASAIAYAATAAGLDLDPTIAAGIAAAVYAAVVDRVAPIFGYKIPSPTVDRHGRRTDPGVGGR